MTAPRGGGRRFLDLSHAIEAGMITYPGLPGPVIGDHLSREQSRSHYGPGTEFHIGKIDMVANTGTYIDAPFHRYADRPDLSGFALSAVADLVGLLVRAPWTAGRAVDRPALDGCDLQGKAVLVHTGWDAFWRTDRYAVGHPYLTRGAAQLLAEAGAGLVGIDSLNIDDTTDAWRPAHTILLAAGIPIVEHLCNLAELPDRGFRFFAVPPRVKGLGSFPVRAFAITEA